MTREREPVEGPDYQDVLRAYERLRADHLARPDETSLHRLLSAQGRLVDLLHAPSGRFPLGRVLSTPGAHAAMVEGVHHPAEFLLRHRHGDWGDLCPEDRRVNEDALRYGSRLLSSYRTRLDAKLWVITEWDRSATTILLPDEY